MDLDWFVVDYDHLVLFLQSYDGGFGLCPGLESHGEQNFSFTLTSILLMMEFFFI